MGTRVGYCKCLDYYKNREVTIGSGTYGYKKIHIPLTEQDKKYYGKDINFEQNIKGLINNNSTITKQGGNNYTNGNVNIIIPYTTNY